VEELVDAGVSDKRAICVESEFAAVLKNVARERNTLSAIMRNAWDRGDLRSLTRNSPLKATNAHISILAHCTKIELRKLITDNDMANGLANRFLWLCWKRSKCLPEGGSLRDEELHDVADRIHAAVAFANEHSAAVHRDAEAREMWAAVYPSLSAGKPGLLGAATSRAEAQVLRLSLLYALLDQSSVIRVSHLESALALWQYAEDSARFVFGSALGDPTADAILTLLKTNPGGLTRTEISEHFKRNKPADELARALKTLYELGAARFDKQGSDTPGRPVERWSAVES
jgi:hypothetical protein